MKAKWTENRIKLSLYEDNVLDWRSLNKCLSAPLPFGQLPPCLHFLRNSPTILVRQHGTRIYLPKAFNKEEEIFYANFANIDLHYTK